MEVNSYKLRAITRNPVEHLTSRVRFADVEADLATGELCQQGRIVRLQEQPRQVLAALLERPGEVVTREALRNRLWEGDTFVDFEHGLNTAIKKLRQALGDSADQPRFVETLARRGYRFIAPVTSPAPTQAAPPAELPTRWATVDDRSRLSPTGRAALALALAGAIGVAAWLALMPRASSEIPRRTPAQLAVLPLRVLAPDEDSTYLGVGIADAITTRLANVRQIALRPTTAVLPYQSGELDPERIASTLGVEHLLVGTIQQAEGSYRIGVQLVGRDGVAIWGRSYDLPRAGLLRLQDDVAEHVVAALRLELSPPERARLNVRHTANAEAYERYLRGRALLVNYTDVKIREAIAQFEHALDLDPDYALARAALATGCAWFSVRYSHESRAASWGQRAVQEARRALEQDSALAEAHLAIANAAGTLHGGFDWSTLMTETATALAMDASLELAYVARMRALYHLGLFDETRLQGRRARALNPNPDVESARVEVAVKLFSGEFKDAVEDGTALLRRTDAPVVRQYVGLALYYLGDIAGSREMLASAMREGQPDVRSQASLASVEAASGLRAEARARARAVERGPYMDHHVAYSLGAAWAQLGDAAASIRWLRQAADTGFPCYPWFARDKLLDPVRSEPAFKEFMTRLETQQRIALPH